MCVGLTTCTGRLIGVQHRIKTEFIGQRFNQGLQVRTALARPPSQRRAGDKWAGTLDRFLPGQLEVIQELHHQHSCQQARSRYAKACAATGA